MQAQNAAVVAADGDTPAVDADDETPKIQYWMTPNLLSGILVFLFLVLVSLFFFGLLASVQVPIYQLPANDEKNKDNNRDWAAMWGNLEKW